MKKLTCELCGGTDFIKQDGVFVCQECGTKYSVEEAKKLMSEVEKKTNKKTTTSNTITTPKLLITAQNEFDAGNMVKAEENCNKLLENDPNNYQALVLKGKSIIKSEDYNRIDEAIHFMQLSLRHTPEDKLKKQQKEIASFMGDFFVEIANNSIDNYYNECHESISGHGFPYLWDAVSVAKKNINYSIDKIKSLALMCNYDTIKYTTKIKRKLDDILYQLFTVLTEMNERNYGYSFVLSTWNDIMQYSIMINENDDKSNLKRYEDLITMLNKKYENISHLTFLTDSSCDKKERKIIFQLLKDCHQRVKELDPNHVIPEKYL